KEIDGREYTSAVVPIGLLREAADEIERLRGKNLSRLANSVAEAVAAERAAIVKLIEKELDSANALPGIASRIAAAILERAIADERHHRTAAPITLALDAAVEIERLRAALQKIADPEWGEYRIDEAIVKHVVKIARAALKGTS